MNGGPGRQLSPGLATRTSNQDLQPPHFHLYGLEMSAPEGFTLDQIKTAPITEEIRCFTVSLGVDQLRGRKPTTALIGSGTLISWKKKFGILTASHVIKESNLHHAPILRLGGIGYGEVWDFDVKHLTFHTIGQYREETEAGGPDLAVIELPLANPKTQLLTAKKSFYNLEMDQVLRTATVKGSSGLMAIAGTLEESRNHLGTTSGIDGVRYDGFVGYPPHREYFRRDDFDYFDVTVGYEAPFLPDSYEGMSGGGLWKIPVFGEPTGEVTTRSALLAGVNFYQFAPIDATRGIIRCHGVDSVYKVVSL